MNFIASLFFFALFTFGGRSGLDEVALKLTFESGVCSGTAVGKNLVLTAEHCFEGDGKLTEIDGKPANALELVKDGKDHVLVRVDHTFKKWAKVGNQPKQGDRLTWIGNPAGEVDMYREGYVSRVRLTEIFIDGRTFFGDSGSGLFNLKGQVVGVISGIMIWGNPFETTMQFAVAFPLEFTEEQWKEAESTSPDGGVSTQGSAKP